MRRTLIIIGIVIVVIGIGVIAYLTFGPTAPHLTVSNNNNFSDTGAGTVTPTQAPGEATAASGAGTQVAPNLIEITSSPVAAGFATIDIPAASTTSTTTSGSTGPTLADVAIRYIDRQSGNVYEYRAVARSLTRISDKTLPGIQQASWLPDGSMAIVRFLADSDSGETLDTYALPADGSDGYFLAQNLDEAQVLGQNSIFTLMAGTNSSIGTLAGINGSNATTLFTTPLSGIIVYPAGSGFIAATKAASEIGGYAFSINSTTGVFTPVLGPLNGLTVLPSPSGQYLLYSYTDGTLYHMGVLNLATGAVTPLPVATIAEKCVWAGDNVTLYCGIPTSFSGNLPDDWYQGAVSFTDRIWRINLTTRLATMVVNPAVYGNTLIDAVNPTLDPSGQYLVFRNKKDSSLWIYTL